MTKKRTSALSSIKLLLVVPVIGLVVLAISAYKDVPNFPDNQIVPITASEISSPVLSSPASGLLSEPSATSTKPAVLSSKPSTRSSSVSKSEAMSPPPPPPLPSSSEIKEDVKIVKEEVTGESESTPFIVVEEMPLYPGGDAALLKYIAENTYYPETAKANNIQGRVIIRFCVTAEGGVNRISVLKGVDPDLDAEAMRVVKSLPVFKPGKQKGKAVPVWYMVPITFTLK